jgi:carboxyl-terminal processing protease
MKFSSKLTMISVSLWLAVSSAQAVQPEVSEEQLPILSPESQHATAAKRVAFRFTRFHYKHINLNDEFSQRIFDRYIESLDFNRNIFTQADIDSFKTDAISLDDQLKDGENDVAFAVYNLSVKRRFERYQYALSLLDQELNFDSDETIELDRSEAQWPADEAELNELWRQRVKYDALNLALTGKEWSEVKTTLVKRYNNAVKRLTQTHSEDVFQLYMNAFSREVDPHTSYLSPRSAEQFRSEMNLSLEGIGAVLQLQDDYTVINSLVVGGPASQSNQLTEGDRIVGVGQDGEEIVDIIGWRLDDVVQLIKGPKGTKVNLQILPEGNDAKSHVVTIVRDKIRLEDRAVKSEVIELNGKKIGVLEVPSFYVGLAEDTNKLIDQLKQQSIDGIIVDLRNNGGGALSEATALSGLFIDKGAIVQVRDSYGRVNVNNDTDGLISYDGPMTVLINRYSASASEIFAAALQDYGRAIILGENSYGKGTVQQHRSLNNIYDVFDNELGYVQYTIQKFYRINGGSTQNKGVIPDILFPTAIDPSATGESVEDNALPWDSIDRVEYATLHNYQPLIASLTSAHKQRIQDDLEFSFIAQDIATYQLAKDENSASLNLVERKQELDDLDAKKLERANLRRVAKGEKPYATLDDIPKDYSAPDAYLNEAVAITVDMVNDKK